MLQQGFFDIGVSHAPKKQVSKRYRNCDDCGFFVSCKNPKFEVKGQGKKGILLIGEHPTERDDQRGRYFSGRDGGTLWDLEEEMGVNLEEDCYFLYAVQCCPHTDKRKKEYTTKVNKATEICRERLHKAIEELSPSVIIPMGEIAVDGLIGDQIKGRLSGTKRSAFFGWQIPDRQLNTWVCPTYGLGKIASEFDPTELVKLFKSHFKAAYKLSDTKLPRLYDKVEWTMSQEEAMGWIREAMEHKSYVAYDYETTGVSPVRDGHEIVCASIAFDGKGYAFPFFKTNSWRKIWKEFLTCKDIKTVAHNASFEHRWTKNRAGLDYWPENLGWDTVIGAHCLRNQAPTSLKFQTYVNMGVLGFDGDVDPFITSPAPGEDGKSTLAFNKIHDCPLSVLLKYNAYDSLYTLQLFDIQEKEMTPFLLEGFMHFMSVSEMLTKVTEHGMNIRTDKMDIGYKQLSTLIEDAKECIYELEAVKEYGELDINSNQQLVKFFYDHLELPVSYVGKKVDEKALSQYDHPVVKLLLEYKKLIKLRDTYLGQFKREVYNGLIHPAFNLNRVISFRTSSSGPNLQNTPIRQKNGNKYIRGIIYPDEGCQICEYDYKSLEVQIGTTYHQDPNMIKYLNDPAADFHTDTAKDLFMREGDSYTKHERGTTKNSFVFPQFYGSTARPKQGEEIGVVTRDLWENVEQETRDHLISSGIKDIRDFQAHVMDVERILWEERFPVYNEWRTKTWKEYKRKGYLDLYTGFRVYAPISWTQAINLQTQGTASHVLLYTMERSYPLVREISGRSHFTAQIHDSIVSNMHPEDAPEADRIIKYFGTERVVERYPQLEGIPLIIEKDVAPVDAPWSEKQEMGRI